MNVKKALVLITMLAMLALVLPLNAQEEESCKRFSASAGVGIFRSDDGEYRDLHGSAALVPVIRLAATVWGPFHAWASAWFSSDTSSLPAFPEVESTARQRSIALGLGYHRVLMPRLTLRAQLGLAFLHMEEEAMGLKMSESKSALALGLEANYALSSSLYLGLAIQGNTRASVVPEMNPDQKMALGGLTTSLQVGFVF